MTPELSLRAAAARYLDITRHGFSVDDMTDEQESDWQVTRATLERALHTDSAMTQPSRDVQTTLLSAAEVAEGLRTALLNAVASAEAMRDVLKSMAEPAEHSAATCPAVKALLSACDENERHIRANVPHLPPDGGTFSVHAIRGIIARSEPACVDAEEEARP